MLRIISVAVLFTFILSDAQIIRNCASTIGHVKNSTVVGSKIEGGRYILRRGTNVGIGIIFDTETEVQNVVVAVTGIINGNRIPYPFQNPDGCVDLTCPLKKGGPYVYKTTMHVSIGYPPIAVDVEWALQNENREVIACVLIPAKIK